MRPGEPPPRILRLGAVVMLACCSFGAFARVPPEGIRLDPGRGGSLQGRIEAARPGDTVVVAPGVYEENLRLDRRIVVIGQGSPILRGTGRGSVMTILADSCVVRDLTIEHSGAMLIDEDAGILIRSRRNTIERNTLRDVLFGVYLLQAEENLVRNNQIVGRKELELGERGSGIHIWNSTRNRCTGNSITDVRDGFYIRNANHTWIEGNEVSRVRYGLHYMYADSNVLLRNRFSDNVAGAAIMYSRGIVMRHNVFSRNRGFSSYGILFQDCHGMVADSNVITDNVVGMFFEASTHNLFRHNVLARNDLALHMFQNAGDNTFTENAFIDNLRLLSIVGKRTNSRWSSDGRGNYWSGYDGYDLDGDGTGDVRMTIQNVFDYLEGRNENVRLYLYSPASQALALAARAFPLLGMVNNELDVSPQMQPVDFSGMPAMLMTRGAARDDGTTGSGRSNAWFALPLVGALGIGLVYHRVVRRLTA